jgi:hypothetical protein
MKFVVCSPWSMVSCDLSVVGWSRGVTAAHVNRVEEFDSPCYKGQRTTDNRRSEDKATCCP